jgi:Na+/H+-dicarboxylate symporter
MPSEPVFPALPDAPDGDRVARSVVHALCGLVIGAFCAAALNLGPAIAAGAQALVRIYESLAPLLLFAILAPSLTRLLVQNVGGLRRFSLFTVIWFSRLRLAVCAVAGGLVVLLYGLPPEVASTAPQATKPAANLLQAVVTDVAGNEYLLAIVASGVTAWLLRRRQGRVVTWFLRLPDLIEATGNVLTKLTGVFGVLVGAYIVTLPSFLRAAVGEIGGAELHPITLHGWQIDMAAPGGLLRAYLFVTAVTAVICISFHVILVTWSRIVIPGFRIKAYLFGYLVRVYPLIWSTGSESLAIPSNLSTLRRFGGNIPIAMRDVTVSLAATLDLNGSSICCVVLVPAVCMTIGYPLSALQFAACLPLIFLLGYGIPGIPGELVVFAGPLAQLLGLHGQQHELFLLFFLSWQIGLTDSFRSAGSATDNVPAVLLANESYRRRFGAQILGASVAPAGGSVAAPSSAPVGGVHGPG